MQIKMCINKSGSENGYTIKNFKAGQAYEVTEKLGNVFLKNKWAIRDAGTSIANTSSGKPIASFIEVTINSPIDEESIDSTIPEIIENSETQEEINMGEILDKTEMTKEEKKAAKKAAKELRNKSLQPNSNKGE